MHQSYATLRGLQFLEPNLTNGYQCSLYGCITRSPLGGVKESGYPYKGKKAQFSLRDFEGLQLQEEAVSPQKHSFSIKLYFNILGIPESSAKNRKHPNVEQSCKLMHLQGLDRQKSERLRPWSAQIQQG